MFAEASPPGAGALDSPQRSSLAAETGQSIARRAREASPSDLTTTPGGRPVSPPPLDDISALVAIARGHTDHMSTGHRVAERVAAWIDEVRAPLALTLTQKHDLERLCCEMVFAYWQGVFSQERCRLTPKRRAAIVSRLREFKDVSALLYAIDGVAASAYHRGDNDAGTFYAWPEKNIFRSYEQTERWVVNSKRWRSGEQHPWVSRYVAAQASENPASST